jgi:hypothetical protein
MKSLLERMLWSSPLKEYECDSGRRTQKMPFRKSRELPWEPTAGSSLESASLQTFIYAICRAITGCNRLILDCKVSLHDRPQADCSY